MPSSTTLIASALSLASCLAAAPPAVAQVVRDLYLYDDLPLAPWSGFMGSQNGASIRLDLRSTEAPASGVYHARLRFCETTCEAWAGVYLQSSPQNWTGPGPELTAQSLDFLIRSSVAGQTVLVSAFNDRISGVRVTLPVAQHWKAVSIPLSGVDGKDVYNIVAFVVVGPPSGLEVDVDDLHLRFTRPADDPASVTITGSGHPQWDFGLSVDGAPFPVRGIGYDVAASDWTDADTALARDLRANTLRTWGGLDVTFALLDAASSQGLHVIPGFWLFRGDEGEPVDYADQKYRAAVRNAVENWIACFRGHRAVLLWCLGNEVLSNLPTSQRAAFLSLLDELVRDVHALDPSHPVTYADVNLDYAAPILQTAIDAYGANAYGTLPAVLQAFRDDGHSKPMIALEFGCDGWWERDWNSYPDVERAQDYAQRAGAILRAAGVTLGGCAFAWIDKTEGPLGQYTGWGIVDADRSIRPQYELLRFVWSSAAVVR